MKAALWIAVILLTAAVVVLFFRGQSARSSAAEATAWNAAHATWHQDQLVPYQDTLTTWMTILNKELWDLRKFVCERHPVECVDPDKAGPPPPPPPTFP